MQQRYQTHMYPSDAARMQHIHQSKQAHGGPQNYQRPPIFFACNHCAIPSFTCWLVVKIASRGRRNETTIAERVSHVVLTTQRILPKFARGVTFKGSTIGRRCGWRWTPTTNQDVNDSTITRGKEHAACCLRCSLCAKHWSDVVSSHTIMRCSICSIADIA
jgi:hypothetical protein